MVVSWITLVVVLSGILHPHFVLSLTKLAHGSKRCPADILMGKLGREVGRIPKKHQGTACWVVLSEM